MKAYSGLLQLAVGVLLVPLIVWFFGFRQTVSLWREWDGNRSTIAQLNKSKDAPSSFRQEPGEYTPVLYNGSILDRMAGMIESGRISVVRYTPYITHTEERIQIHTGEMVLSGFFIPLLKTLDFVEKNSASGKIVSVGFKKQIDRIKRTEQLLMTVVLQQLVME